MISIILFLSISMLLIAGNSEGKPLPSEEEEEPLYAKIFVEMDQDLDLSITYDEFRSAIEKSTRCDMAKYILEPFRQTDTNGDGNVTMEEALAPTDVMFPGIEKKVLENVDMDGDGKLSFGEAVVMPVEIYWTRHQPEMIELFKSIDKNHDGKISALEFVDIVIDESTVWSELKGWTKFLILSNDCI